MRRWRDLGVPLESHSQQFDVRTSPDIIGMPSYAANPVPQSDSDGPNRPFKQLSFGVRSLSASYLRNTGSGIGLKRLGCRTSPLSACLEHMVRLTVRPSKVGQNISKCGKDNGAPWCWMVPGASSPSCGDPPIECEGPRASTPRQFPCPSSLTACACQQQKS